MFQQSLEKVFSAGMIVSSIARLKPADRKKLKEYFDEFVELKAASGETVNLPEFNVALQKVKTKIKDFTLHNSYASKVEDKVPFFKNSRKKHTGPVLQLDSSESILKSEMKDIDTLLEEIDELLTQFKK